MLRFLKTIFVVTIGAALLIFGVANSESVTLRLSPENMAYLWGEIPSFSVPLFQIITASIIFGVVIGVVFEWVRARKSRREAARQGVEFSRLRDELSALKAEMGIEERDEVLSLLENSTKRR